MHMVATLLVLFLTGQPTDLAAAAPPKQSQPAPLVADLLRQATNAFAYGNYDEASALLQSLLYPMRLYSDAQVIKTRRYLGMAHYFLGEHQRAVQEFVKLLYLSPDYELDPFLIAPPIIEVFEKVRRDHHIELDVVRERTAARRLETPVDAGTLRTITVTTTFRSDFATFMPFGVGQFKNRDVGWGVAFAGAEIALLAINIGSYIGLRSMRTRDFGGGSRPGFEPKKRGLVQALTITQFSSLALFGVTWTMGVFHARLHFVPSIQRRNVDDTRTASALHLGPGVEWAMTF